VSESFSLQALADLSGARLRGDGSLPIVGVASLEAAGVQEIALFHQPRYRDAFVNTRAGAVVVRAKTAEALPESPVALLVADDPPLAFARISAALHPPAQATPGIDARAFVHPSAHVDPSAEIAPFSYVGAGARVGERSALMPFAYVGPKARVGNDCRLHPSAVVATGCVLGDRVVLQAGAVVGSDGFGYALDPGVPAHLKVPQIGIVRIEDDVEIGANSCIDRATLGETVIGHGSKLDNQVQVAHNVRVGPLSILCAQVGIAGSTTIGQGVVMAGQVGVVGHIQVGDGAKLGAKAGVMADVPAGQTQTGAPARPHTQFLRQMAAEQRLPEMLRRLAALEKRLAELTLRGPSAPTQSEIPLRKNEP
jgi:UDP-3-O-[3-hydroxymyristoyl] glucosamine N-acyltransferase